MARLIQLLLVDDSPEDIDLTMEALASMKLANNISVVHDGVEAMRFLRREGQYSEAPRPSVILLDLNMPKKDGREVLEEIKADHELKDIPVVILTTSKDEEDIVRSYKSHANCYVSKPVDMRQFEKVVRSIEDFWFAVVELPPGSRPNHIE